MIVCRRSGFFVLVDPEGEPELPDETLGIFTLSVESLREAAFGVDLGVVAGEERPERVPLFLLFVEEVEATLGLREEVEEGVA